MLIPRVESFHVIFFGSNLATTFRASGEAVHGDSVILIETCTRTLGIALEMHLILYTYCNRKA